MGGGKDVPKGTARRLPRICPFCFIKMAVMNWIGLYLHPPGPLSDGVAKNQIEQHRLWSLFPGDTVKLRFSPGQWKCQFIALPDRKADVHGILRDVSVHWAPRRRSGPLSAGLRRWGH